MTCSRPGPHHPTAVLPSPQGAPFRTTLGRTDMLGPTRTLRFIGTELQNRKRFLKRCGQWARGVPPLGGPARCQAGQAPGSAGLDTGRCCSFALSMASWRPWLSVGAEGSPETGRGDGGGRRAGAEPAGEEEEALQFGLVFMESALAQGWSGPPGSGSGAGLSQRPRWRWTGRHLAVLPGPGRGLRARLGHQDGLLPNFQDVC